MKVYEMKPNEIGEAVETEDAIIVTLHEWDKDRVLIISRKDMTISSIKVNSINVTDSSDKKNLGTERGAMVKKDRAHVVYKNVLDEFRHAKTDDEMMDVIKKFYPLYKPNSMDTLVYVYKRAVADGVISIPARDIVKKRRRLTRHKKKMNDLTYLPIKENPLFGKSISSTIYLKVYKRYGVRLWNNLLADTMSRVNSAKENAVSIDWMKDTIGSVFSSYKMPFSLTRYNAYAMFLRESNLVTLLLNGRNTGAYIIHRAPEIPRTIST